MIMQKHTHKIMWKDLAVSQGTLEGWLTALEVKLPWKTSSSTAVPNLGSRELFYGVRKK